VRRAVTSTRNRERENQGTQSSGRQQSEQKPRRQIVDRLLSSAAAILSGPVAFRRSSLLSRRRTSSSMIVSLRPTSGVWCSARGGGGIGLSGAPISTKASFSAVARSIAVTASPPSPERGPQAARFTTGAGLLSKPCIGQSPQVSLLGRDCDPELTHPDIPNWF
jgi:hypothetical protein